MFQFSKSSTCAVVCSKTLTFFSLFETIVSTSVAVALEEDWRFQIFKQALFEFLQLNCTLCIYSLAAINQRISSVKGKI